MQICRFVIYQRTSNGEFGEKLSRLERNGSHPQVGGSSPLAYPLFDVNQRPYGPQISRAVRSYQALRNYQSV